MEYKTKIIFDLPQKYILVTVTHLSEELIILWGDPVADSHRNILREILYSGIELRKILGGGWIHRVSESKEVHLWGQSRQFGKADNLLVAQCLTENLPGYRVVYLEEA